jgi:hypothetical protein
MPALILPSEIVQWWRIRLAEQGGAPPNSAAVRLHGLRRSRIGGISSELPAPLPPPHLHEAPATAAIATSPCLVRVPPPHYVNPARGGGESVAWESRGLASVPTVVVEAADIERCGSSFPPPTVGVTDLDSSASTSPHLDYLSHAEPYPTPHQVRPVAFLPFPSRSP